MSSYEADGRVNQKRRTRDALIAAARDLIAADGTLTVERAAAAAGVSRATAYRYFPTQWALLLAAHPETGATSMLPVDAPAEPSARLAAVVRSFTQLIVDTEPQQRTMLRLSLGRDPDAHEPLPLRQGRAIGWIHEALEPLRGTLTEPELDRLVLAIRSAIGIESLAWLTDIAGATRDEATDLMQWTAQGLLFAALNWTPPPPPTDQTEES